MVNSPSLKVYKLVTKMPRGRAFFFSSDKKTKCKGSMAVEGSLVLPLFLLFLMTVLLGLEAVRLQSNITEALHQAGNYYMMTVNGEEDGIEEENHIMQRVGMYMDDQLLPYLCIKGGKNGLRLEDISSLGEGKVELTSEYQISEVIWWLPVGEIVIKDHFVGHPWTGYLGREDIWSKDEKVLYVYVTQTGSRYHLSTECSYLKVQIKQVSANWLSEGRNKWGAKYYPCSKCKPSNAEMLYVTEDGNNYHSSNTCPALKRTVYIIPLHEADAYSGCSRCGK